VLVVVVLLTLAAYQFSEMMMSEYRAADSFSRTSQSKALDRKSTRLNSSHRL